MTKDLAIIIAGSNNVQRDKYMNTEEFVNKIAETFKSNWN
jgi:hypothetical protein